MTKSEVSMVQVTKYTSLKLERQETFLTGPLGTNRIKVTLQTSKTFFASKSRKTKDKLTSRCHVQFWYFFTGFLTGGRPKWHRGNKPNLALINGPWYLVVGHVAVPYDFGKPGKILIIHCKVSWQSFTALVFFTFRIESNYTARSWKWNVVIPKRTCTDSSA